MENSEHKRRVRYSGTHPKKFSEKYKEHDPLKYKDTIEHVISKGMTPAGMHISIMVKEILEFLDVKPGQIGLDATLGYGGHSKAILEKLDGCGHLYSLDIDPIEIINTKNRLEALGYNEEVLTIKQINFRNIDLVSPSEKFDFLMADLGVSSMQIDNPDRGFSFKKEGPLDLRLNPSDGISASDRLFELSKSEIEGMLIENSDEPFASEIAAAICKTQKSGPILTTTQLRDVIRNAISPLVHKDFLDVLKKTCQRVMQAIRIDVNSELEALHEFMDKLPTVMKSGGRIAILTFHSGEDRIVKKAFKEGLKKGIYREVARDVIRPTAEECLSNPRSKSTKMRYAVLA